MKKLRYAAEFCGEALGASDRVEAYREILARLQACLGRICDASVMVHRVEEAVPERSAFVACVRGWSACTIHVERRRLNSLWRAFRKTERFW